MTQPAAARIVTIYLVSRHINLVRGCPMEVLPRQPSRGPVDESGRGSAPSVMATGPMLGDPVGIGRQHRSPQVRHTGTRTEATVVSAVQPGPHDIVSVGAAMGYRLAGRTAAGSAWESKFPNALVGSHRR